MVSEPVQDIMMRRNGESIEEREKEIDIVVFVKGKEEGCLMSGGFLVLCKEYTNGDGGSLIRFFHISVKLKCVFDFGDCIVLPDEKILEKDDEFEGFMIDEA